MSNAIRSKVFFRPKQIKQPWMLHFVDTMLILWMGTDRASDNCVRRDRLAVEIQAYLKAMEMEEFRARGEDPILSYLRKHDQSPDLGSVIVSIKDIFRKVAYSPDLEVANEINSILKSHLQDEWRDDTSIEWELDGDQILALFNICIWTIRELEGIAKKVVEKTPSDIGIRNLLAHLRLFAYQRASSLVKVAVNPDDFYQELRSERFCPSTDVMGFWKELGLQMEFGSIHPIDKQLQAGPDFLATLKVVHESLDSHASRSQGSLSNRTAAYQLMAQISLVTHAWEVVLNEYFHLGPTSRLLDLTSEAMGQVQKWLQPQADAKDEDEHGSKYRTAFATQSECFTRAAKKLMDASCVGR